MLVAGPRLFSHLAPKLEDQKHVQAKPSVDYPQSYSFFFGEHCTVSTQSAVAVAPSPARWSHLASQPRVAPPCVAWSMIPVCPENWRETIAGCCANCYGTDPLEFPQK